MGGYATAADVLAASAVGCARFTRAFLALTKGTPSEDEVEERERMRRALYDLTTQGWVLSAHGVQVMGFDELGQLDTTSHPTDTVYSVSVEERGTTHVDVRIGTTQGDLSLPFVVRSQELMDALRTLADRPDAPWALGLETSGVVPLGRS